MSGRPCTQPNVEQAHEQRSDFSRQHALDGGMVFCNPQRAFLEGTGDREGSTEGLFRSGHSERRRESVLAFLSGPLLRPASPVLAALFRTFAPRIPAPGAQTWPWCWEASRQAGDASLCSVGGGCSSGIRGTCSQHQRTGVLESTPGGPCCAPSTHSSVWPELEAQ